MSICKVGSGSPNSLYAFICCSFGLSSHSQKKARQEVAQFVSIEIKTERGKLTNVQQNWLQKVKSSGGIVGVARTVKDALQILKV